MSATRFLSRRSESNRAVLLCASIRRGDLAQFRRWRSAFANERKDYRYYELIEDTLQPEFDYRYVVIKHARAVQPFFLIDQDLLVGMSPRFAALVGGIRKMAALYAGAHLDDRVGCWRRSS
jgi:hypothetical protein